MKYFRVEEDDKAKLPKSFLGGFLEVCCLWERKDSTKVRLLMKMSGPQLSLYMTSYRRTVMVKHSQQYCRKLIDCQKVIDLGPCGSVAAELRREAVFQNLLSLISKQLHCCLKLLRDDITSIH